METSGILTGECFFSISTQMISNQFNGANQTIQGAPSISKDVAHGMHFDCLATSVALYLHFTTLFWLLVRITMTHGTIPVLQVLHVSLQQQTLVTF